MVKCKSWRPLAFAEPFSLEGRKYRHLQCDVLQAVVTKAYRNTKLLRQGVSIVGERDCRGGVVCSVVRYLEAAEGPMFCMNTCWGPEVNLGSQR